MNTKQILVAMAVVAAMSASSAMAQGTPPAAPVAAPVAAAQGSKDKVQNDQKKFEERKAKALSRLEKRAADVQKKQSCVQAATDGKSLDACFPKKGKWNKRGEKSFKSGGADKSDTGAAPVKN